MVFRFIVSGRAFFSGNLIFILFPLNLLNLFGCLPKKRYFWGLNRIYRFGIGQTPLRTRNHVVREWL